MGRVDHRGTGLVRVNGTSKCLVVVPSSSKYAEVAFRIVCPYLEVIREARTRRNLALCYLRRTVHMRGILHE